MNDNSSPHDTNTNLKQLRLDLFDVKQDQLQALCVQPLKQVMARQVTMFSFRTTAIGRMATSSIYSRPAVLLHRRGLRRVTLRENQPASPTDVRDGLVSLIPPGWEIHPHYLEPCEGILVAMTQELIQNTAQRLGINAWFHARAGIDDPLLAGLCETCFKSGCGTLFTESVGQAIAVHLLETYGESQPAEPLWLQRVRQFVNRSLTEKQAISVTDMARCARISRHHFSRLFKQTVGQTPQQYLLLCRIDRAKELLQNPQMTLANVALYAGFCDQSHLNHHFQRILGMTPAIYRDEIQHKDPKTTHIPPRSSSACNLG